EDLLAQAKTLEAEQAAERARLDGLRAKVLEDARTEAHKERAALLSRAEEEAQDLRRRERERLRLEREQLAQEALDSSLESARRVTVAMLGRLELPALDTHLLHALVAKLEDEPEQDPSLPPANLVVARDLTEREEQAVLSELRKHLNSELSPVVLRDEALISGFRLQVGNHIYDASLAAQLDKLFARAAIDLRSQGGAVPTGS